jgi:hypothetical protein
MCAALWTALFYVSHDNLCENASITIGCIGLQANLFLIFPVTGRNLRLAARKIHSWNSTYQNIFFSYFRSFLCLCFFTCVFFNGSRNSVNGVATGPRTGLSAVRILLGVKGFSLLSHVESSSGTHPTSYSVGTGVSSPGVKRSERNDNKSGASSAEVKNVWS